MYSLLRQDGSCYWRLDYRFDGKCKTLALGVWRNLFLQTIAAINEMLMAGLPDQALMLRICHELIRGDLFRMAWIGLADEDGVTQGRGSSFPAASRG
jgi:hypothetical protein